MERLTWNHRFLLASLLTLVLGMTGIGWWISSQIEAGVIHQSAAYSSLYVSSIVEPDLQELAGGGDLSPRHTQSLDHLVRDTGLGQNITAIKVWNPEGRVVYASQSNLTGQSFPVDSDLKRALHGWVASEISTLEKAENALDRDRGLRRLETYSPVRRTGSNQIIAAVEFYQTLESLDRNLADSQRNSWLVVATATVLMYLLLAGFVRQAGRTLQRQRTELHDQVGRLELLLSQNQLLHNRVRRAARGTTARNEQFLRRISAELHDGPAQDLGFALLRLDRWSDDTDAEFQQVKASLSHALSEIRAISAGMGLPELEDVDLAETLRRAVRAHERRTGSTVALSLGPLPATTPLPVKITTYRIAQEALTNAWRHAGGVDQRVEASANEGGIRLVISDGGPGWDVSARESEDHWGLTGMRERAESLGGSLVIVSESGRGTRVEVQLPGEGPS
jgi:signal transduction histidine kinase